MTVMDWIIHNNKSLFTGGEDPKTRPERIGLGEAHAAHMAEVLSRFDGDEWSSREHYRIKQLVPLDSMAHQENKFLKAWRDKVQQGGMSDKNRRISLQVGE